MRPTTPTNTSENVADEPARDRHDDLREGRQLVLGPEVLEHLLEAGNDEDEQDREHAEEDQDDDAGYIIAPRTWRFSFIDFSM